jgi:hypothetical protein
MVILYEEKYVMEFEIRQKKKKAIIKILLCVIVMVVNFIISVNPFLKTLSDKNLVLSIVRPIIHVLIFFGGMYYLEYATTELEEVSERLERIEGKYLNKKPKQYSEGMLLSLVKENDIIEIKLLYGGKVIEVGAASDCTPSHPDFFDKIYFIEYIDRMEFEDINQFREEARKYMNGKFYDVVSIDGIFENE